jgi:tripartite ATP-independent transporter DctP family solute receptor
MRKETSFLALGLVLGALLTAGAFIALIRSDKAARVAGGGTRQVLKLAHALDQSHPVHAGMVHMAERLAVLSGGTVELQIFPNGQLGSEPETIEQLQRGAVAIVKTSAAAMEGFVPEMAVFGLPYLFRDEGHYWRVLGSEVGRELLAAGSRVNMRGLCYYDSGSRSFYTVRTPILTPADLRGMKIRVQSSRMAMDMISAFGGSPTPIPWGELYTALQQGMVDGAENNPPSLLSSRHYEVARHYTINEHTRVPDLLVFSEQIWKTLSPEVRQWVQQAADESVVFQRKLWAEKTQEALTQLEATGMKVYRPDQAAFAAATAAMRSKFDGTPIGELARRIEEVK